MAEVRNTVQKNIVLNTVFALKIHPTAETLCKHIHAEYPTISRATVYRILNQLASQGTILRIQIPNGADCYDFNAEQHYHIRCIGCDCVEDAVMEYKLSLNQEAEQGQEMKILGHQIVFDGICAKCQAKEDE